MVDDGKEFTTFEWEWGEPGGAGTRLRDLRFIQSTAGSLVHFD